MTKLRYKIVCIRSHPGKLECNQIPGACMKCPWHLKTPRCSKMTENMYFSALGRNNTNTMEFCMHLSLDL